MKSLTYVYTIKVTCRARRDTEIDKKGRWRGRKKEERRGRKMEKE